MRPLADRFPASERGFMLALLGLALAARILPAAVNFVVGTDESRYLTLGQNLAGGRGYTEDGVTPHTEFAPAYPLFAAGVYALGGGPELPARLNLLVFGALIALPAYALARELADAGTARRTALLTALLPALALAVPNFEAPTEQMYMVFLWSGWLFVWRALTRPERRHAPLAGLCLGLAHLTRIEGILYVFIAGLLLVLTPTAASARHTSQAGASRREWTLAARASRLALFALTAAVFAVPYALYVHDITGLWLAPKGLLHQYHGEALRSADPLAFEAAYIDYEYNREHLSELPGMLEYLWLNRAELPGFYARNLATELRQALTSVSFMLILWLPLAAWGARNLWRSPGGPGKCVFLGLAAAPALVYPLSVVDPRYLLPLLPGAMLLTAAGLKPEAAPDDRGPKPARSWPSIAWPFVIGIFALATLIGPFLIHRPVEYKALGLWMRDHGIGADGAGILARKRQPAFYAGARWEWLPLADVAGVLAYAAGHDAQYAVIDERTVPTLRPQLADLLDPRAAPDSLEFLIELEENGMRVLLYRIKPAQ